MGLFDKLFKKKESASKPVDIIESRISRNPYSSLYRLPYQETEKNINTLEYIDFYQKSCGRFVALDFETTGLNDVNDKIIEIGAVRVSDGQIIESYQQYVNPGIPVSAGASAVNHITDDMLYDKPYIYEVLPDLLHFIGSDIVVAHNAAFEIRFLAQSCMLYRFKIPDDWFDSMDLKIIWPDLESRKLQSFLSAACIVNKNAHSAIGDAEALANLMIVSMQKPFHIQLPPDFDFGFSNEHFTGTIDKIDNVLSGKRFCLTGEIVGHERLDVEKLIAAHGGKSSLKISNATDYLVRGVFRKLPPFYVSAKEQYAERLISEGGKIQIISPEKLFSMMNEVL